MANSTQSDIVVVGSCNMDLISYTKKMPSIGETIIGDKFEIGFGGKGANQCIMSAKLGAKVAMVSCLGDDTFGKQTLENFRTHKVLTDHISVCEGVSTGVAPIIVTPSGDNSIIIIPGANMHLTDDSVDKAVEVIKNAKVLLCQLEISPSVTLHALKVAKQYNLTTILNTAPAMKISEELYTYVDILCLNETECEVISGLYPDTDVKIQDALHKLLSMGFKCIVLTLGEKGLFYTEKQTNDQIIKFWSIPAPKVEVTDTTGAGDAFIGSLAFYLAYYETIPFKDKLQRAVKIASNSVTKCGTQISYPFKNNLESSLF